MYMVFVRAHEAKQSSRSPRSPGSISVAYVPPTALTAFKHADDILVDSIHGFQMSCALKAACVPSNDNGESLSLTDRHIFKQIALKIMGPVLTVTLFASGIAYAYYKGHNVTISNNVSPLLAVVVRTPPFKNE